MKENTDVHIEMMLDEIEQLGYVRPTIDMLHKSSTKLSSEVVEIILKWLPAVYDNRIGSGEHLIRALITTKEPFNPSVIIDLFDNSNLNDSLKWTMAYVLSIANIFDTSAYIRDQLFNKPSDFKRRGFLASLDKNALFEDRKQLLFALRKLFDKYDADEYILKLFKKYGSDNEIVFLENRLSKIYDQKKRDEIEKIIIGIKKRKKETKFP